MKTDGCFCGAIRYKLTGDEYKVVNCHCTMCRKTSGAPYVSWLFVPTGEFQLIKGDPNPLKSSTHGTRGFCLSCGSPITCVSAHHPDIIDITLGSVDDPESLSPTLDVYVDTKLPWITLAPTENSKA